MTNSYKILYLQATSEIGGSDISLSRILEKLDRKRFSPYAILPSEGPLVEKLRGLGVKVWILPDMMKLSSRGGILYRIKYLLYYFPAVFKIAAYIRREKIDLVHTNTLHNLHGWLAAAAAGVPHVWHVREIVRQSNFFLGLERFLTRYFSTKVIVTSDAVAENLYPGGGSAPVVKIPNGIDLKEFNPDIDPGKVFQDLKLAPKTPLIGFAGRLDHWKGVDVFLKAAALCRQEFPDARFLVAGGEIPGREDYAKEMTQLASQLGIQDIVFFTGWRYQPKDMPQVYAALSVFALPSTWPEPFGLVLLEAMAAAKPVVATRHGGPLEICAEGETAILVPPGDAEKMAEAFGALLREPARVKNMGAAGRRRVEKLYDSSQSIRQLENLYEELLRSRA